MVVVGYMYYAIMSSDARSLYLSMSWQHRASIKIRIEDKRL